MFVTGTPILIEHYKNDNHNKYFFGEVFGRDIFYEEIHKQQEKNNCYMPEIDHKIINVTTNQALINGDFKLQIEPIIKAFQDNIFEKESNCGLVLY